MPTVSSTISSPNGLGPPLLTQPTQSPVFRGLTLSFVGFDASSLRSVVENGGPTTGGYNGTAAGAIPVAGALAADVAEAEGILQVMQYKAEEVSFCRAFRWLQ